MWVITIFSQGTDITMLEFNTEKEAREALMTIGECKILSEVIYFNDDPIAIMGD